MEEIKFSIIMPAYNAEKEILSSIESVLKQNYQNYEFLIIDDCSKDNTYEIIKEAERNNSKIRAIKHEVNKKAGGARNTGIKEASGDYILFLDSDDLLYDENVLSNIANVVGNDRPDIVYLGFKSVGDAFRGLFLPDAENSIKENRIKTWNYANVWDVLWKREFLTQKEITFIEGRFFEDFVFYYTGVIKSESYKYAEFPAFIYNSGRADSMTTKITPRKIEDLYYNLIIFVNLINNVDEKYKPMIVEILKDHNLYSNRLLDQMK